MLSDGLGFRAVGSRPKAKKKCGKAMTEKINLSTRWRFRARGLRFGLGAYDLGTFQLQFEFEYPSPASTFKLGFPSADYCTRLNRSLCNAAVDALTLQEMLL